MLIQHHSEELIIFESALYRTTTSLIMGDDYILLVDPNWLPIEIEFIRKFISDVVGDRRKYLLFTHSDYDHIIGYGKFKEYTTIASQSLVSNQNKESVLHQIRTFDDEYYVLRDYEIVYPIIDMVIPTEPFNQNVGSDLFQFFPSPGHTPDGLIAFNQDKGILIAGDYLSNVEFPFIYDNSNAYLRTLNTFQEIISLLQPKILISGHGDHTTSLEEMKSRIKISREYIHRCMRSIQSTDQLEFNDILGTYDFPISLLANHKKNLKFLRNELKFGDK